MNARTKGVVVLLVILIAIPLCFFGIMHYSKAPGYSRTIPALPAGDKAPSKEFMDLWFQYATQRDEIKQIQADKELQRKIDLLNGMGSRLLPQVPPGYTWNEDTLSFHPIPQAPPPPQQPATPPPAKK
jgi:hypothetical protein